MTTQDPPKIEFPCPNYPIKVLGVASDEYQVAVLDIVGKHAPDFDRNNIKLQDSRNGRFHSITVYIVATGVKQLQDIFDDLKKHPSTRMVM